MHRRRLGRAGFEVSEVGYGSWGIGQTSWIGADDQESLRALHRAIDLGLNFVDTALAYGDGHSERLIGRVLRDREERVFVATKVPPANQRWPASADDDPDDVFGRDHLRACVQQSVSNLGVDTLDLLQLHVWSDAWLERGSWRAALEELKAEGLVRAVGVSVNDHDPASALRLVESGAVDTVQVIYNVFDQSPRDALLDACVRNDVGVIARVPFDEGALAGRVGRFTRFPRGDFRRAYFRGSRRREVARRVSAIVDDLGIAREQLPEVALRFVLADRAVSTVSAGMRSVRNVERNCAVADGHGLPEAQRRRLEAHRWQRNFYV
jgi:aryl-alcohol dehydrogenase-like predicted oxidoreductase